MSCQTAQPGDIKQAFQQVHGIWPHDPDPALHLQKRLASVQHQRASWFVVKEQDEVRCSLGAYPFRLFGPEGDRSARVFGAVFTPASHRGRGHAARLIHWVKEYYAAQGTKDFLLYSDIAPAYYQKLGFHVLPSYEWQWEIGPQVEKLPWDLIQLPSHPMDPGEQGLRFGFRRQTEEALWVQAKQKQVLRLVRLVKKTGELTEKWLLSRHDGDTYNLLESNVSQSAADWSSFVSIVSADARQAHCRRVKGWWTALDKVPDLQKQTEITARTEEILMWASQDGAADPWYPAITEQGFRAFFSEHV